MLEFRAVLSYLAPGLPESVPAAFVVYDGVPCLEPGSRPAVLGGRPVVLGSATPATLSRLHAHDAVEAERLLSLTECAADDTRVLVVRLTPDGAERGTFDAAALFDEAEDY